MKTPFQIDWRADLHTVPHFIRHWAKEIFIAVVVAVVAAVAIDRYGRMVRRETMRRNLKAVATLEAFDKNNYATGQGSGVLHHA